MCVCVCVCVSVADLKKIKQIRAWDLYFVVCVLKLLFIGSVVDLKKNVFLFLKGLRSVFCCVYVAFMGGCCPL